MIHRTVVWLQHTALGVLMLLNQMVAVALFDLALPWALSLGRSVLAIELQTVIALSRSRDLLALVI